MREATAFHVVGVVGQVDLYAMVDAAREASGLFGLKVLQQGARSGFVDALRSCRMGGDVPRFARKKGSGNPAGGAVVPDRPF